MIIYRPKVRSVGQNRRLYVDRTFKFGGAKKEPICQFDRLKLSANSNERVSSRKYSLKSVAYPYQLSKNIF